MSFQMLHGKDEVVFRFELENSDKNVKLRIRPLLAYRDMHHLQRENIACQVKSLDHAGSVRFSPYPDMPSLYMQSEGRSRFYPGPDWYREIEYLHELERGFDFREDLFCPGMLELNLNSKGPAYLRFGLQSKRLKIAEAWTKEEERRLKQKKELENLSKSTSASRLRQSAQHFFTQTPDKLYTVQAGFPWFEDWGRDAFIALPGLNLSQTSIEKSEKVLRYFGQYIKQGVVPNYIGVAGGQLSYNSADASLWYILATQMIYYQCKKQSFIDEFIPVIKDILLHFIQGTHMHLGINPDGLIEGGDENSQLTWMDAFVEGEAVTPRFGKAVELNALWYNALCFLREILRDGDIKYGDKTLDNWIQSCKNSFSEQFYLQDQGYLADTVSHGQQDRAIRPNQIFAISLPYSPLKTSQKMNIMAVIEHHLLTPMGLRTLSPEDSRYIAYYKGTGVERDRAYHQGTVWPWLIGAYVEARLKLSDKLSEDRAFLLDYLKPLFESHLDQVGIHSLSEIADATVPHKANGCFAQAWSVAEALRSLHILEENGEIFQPGQHNLENALGEKSEVHS